MTVDTEKKIKRKRDAGGVHTIAVPKDKIYSFLSETKTIEW